MVKIISLIVVILVLILTVFFMRFSDNDEVSKPDGSSPFPDTGIVDNQIQGELKIRMQDGSLVEVRDFRNDQFVQKAYGDYVISDAPGQDAGTFLMQYSTSDSGILVSLRRKPLSEARNNAENALRQHLGVSEENMCNMVISIGVASDVDYSLAGQELGLSFCPGSVELP